MKLLIVGVNGRVGSLVAKDALELTKEEVSHYDVVVDAVGGWLEETIPNITKVMIHLADLYLLGLKLDLS